MKQKRVWLLSGLPGSGKSTWAREQLKKHEPETAIWISRDLIRFGMIKEGEEYFSKENEVFDLFIKATNSAIHDLFLNDIYVDATHLNDKSRNKTLNKLDLDAVDVITHVVFDVPIDICKERNALREGRERVPDSVISNMSRSFQRVPLFQGHELMTIDEKGEVINHGYLSYI